MLDFFNAFKPKSSRGYQALNKDTYAEKWTNLNMGESATADEVEGLKQRTKWLVKNDPYAAKAVNMLQVLMIGEGAFPQVRSKSKNKANIDLVDGYVSDFFDSTECDVKNQNSFYGLQGLLTREMVEAGNSFLRKTNPKGKTVNLKYQAISYDSLATDYNKVTKRGVIINGIEYDSKMKPLNYYFHKYDKSVMSVLGRMKTGKYTRIPADEICHLQRPEDIDQRLGTSWLTTIIPILRMVSNSRLNQLTNQQIQSAITAFVTSDAADGIAAMLGTEDENEKEDSPALSTIIKGQINRLKTGEKVEFMPPADLSASSAFNDTLHRDSSNGMVVSYEDYTGDYTKSNYSSSRAAKNLQNKYIEMLQSIIFIAKCFNDVGKDFINELFLAGKINQSVLDDVSITWSFRKPTPIDAVKEAKANEMDVANGFATIKDVVESKGKDFPKHLEQMEYEQKLLEEKGIQVASLHTLESVPYEGAVNNDDA